MCQRGEELLELPPGPEARESAICYFPLHPDCTEQVFKVLEPASQGCPSCPRPTLALRLAPRTSCSSSSQSSRPVSCPQDSPQLAPALAPAPTTYQGTSSSPCSPCPWDSPQPTPLLIQLTCQRHLEQAVSEREAPLQSHTFKTGRGGYFA